ncbi:MAG: DUF1318 domain-containing protein [Myxococcota bacterium]
MSRAATAAVVAALLVGCVRPPDVIVADRDTALEKQAAGEYRGMARDLRHAGVSHRPEPYTRGELDEAGVDTGETKLDELLRIYSEVRTDADLLDDLLLRHCVGEGVEGLLVETPDTCTGAVDLGALRRAMQRANRNRRQIWTWFARRRPDATDEQIRRTWRANHLETVVCGARIERAEGAWEVKACD